MELDRSLQYRILSSLQKVYPDSMLVQELPSYAHDRQFMGNLFYLQEHGLIQGGDLREPGQCRSMVDAQITKEGLDFLAGDGGLDSIVAPFLLQLGSSDVVELIESALADTDMDEERRTSLVDALKTAEAVVLADIVRELIGRGAEHNVEMLRRLVAAEPVSGPERHE